MEKNPIQWKLHKTKGQGTNKICSPEARLVISRFFSIHFTITGEKNIVCYNEDFVEVR